MGGDGVMAEYNWYNPTTWDMQNNPAYRAGESYYDLTQGENAAPVNEDPLQLAKDLPGIYQNEWNTNWKPRIEQAGENFYEDVQRTGSIPSAITEKLTGIETQIPGTTIGNIFKGYENLGERAYNENWLTNNPIYRWGERLAGGDSQLPTDINVDSPNTGAQFTNNQWTSPNTGAQFTNNQWTLPSTDWGPVKPTEALPPRGKLDMFLQRFGVPPMTQTTAADKLANEQYMNQQEITIDPQTRRMTGGDFEGMNAPGQSAWGSANFGEMAQNWTDKYGDMAYKTKKMQLKQERMKEAAQAHVAQQQAIQQERIRNERAQASVINQQMRGREPGGGGASRSHMGNISQANAQAVAKANEAMGMKGWGLAHGGRVGYKTGGRVGILSVF